jgi:amino acid adenylation domain-containing protein
MDDQKPPVEQKDNLSAAKRALLEQRLRGQLASSPEAGLLRRVAGSPPVLSPGQQRLWFLHQLDPRTPAYNMYQAVRIAGPLDTAALEQSFDEVIRRHEVLRTTFETRDGQPVPVTASTLRLPLVQLDLLSLPAAKREIRVQQLAEEEVSRPFDLRTGPLLRVLLLRLDDADHVMVMTMHHIVSDEWSLGVLWREVAALYAASRNGESPALPDVPLQYIDFAAWQWTRLESAEVKRQLAYWRGKLGGELAELQLPGDRPRPARQSFRGALESLALSPVLCDGLGQVSKREGVTSFVLLLAAFVTLLHRYTGATDLPVGAPITNRSRAELEELVGFFINTLVLRTDLSGDPTFSEVVRRVRATVLEAFAHQDVPFEMLVDALKPQRRLSQNPLFQVMFVLQREPAISGFAPDLRMRPHPVEAGAAKFDLTLFATETAGGLELTFEYSTDIFDQATARRMLNHLRVLLHGIAADADRRISQLPLLTAGERRQLLVEWNAPRTDESADACIHHWFEAQAQRTPAAVAVWFDGGELTYSELNARADSVARRLRGLGVGPEVCVGLCVERSPEMLVGMLAILKAGGAYVPLDPAYPEARLRFAIEDTGAPVVLSQHYLAARLPHTDARVIHLDHEYETAAGVTDAEAAAAPDNLVYVIYTSGSTGRPKGVLVTHRNLAHSTRARIRHYAGVPERFLLLPSFAFDSSVAGIFWTLCTGGTLVLPRPRAEQDVHRLAELIARQGVTHLLCLPMLYQLILEHAEPALLASLRTVIVAGEACPPALPRRHHQRLPGTAIFNEYGPTEATVWSTVFEVPPGSAAPRVPIGRPIVGTQVYVLDAYRQPLPVGVPGELYVGGAGIAGGYLNRPQETGQRFITDPFSDEPGARLYRTGDLVRWLPDGNLEFLGRADQQVKIRGYRIEPGEIEAVLRQHPGVRDAVVTTRSAAAPDDDLCAALLALGSTEADRLLGEVERLPATQAQLR